MIRIGSFKIFMAALMLHLCVSGQYAASAAEVANAAGVVYYNASAQANAGNAAVTTASVKSRVEIPLHKIASALKNATPGDTLFVAPGKYESLNLNWSVSGDAETPIVVAAREKGSVTVMGESSLRISGTGLEVSGLNFVDGTPGRSTVVEFRNGDSLAYNCRLTNCVIDNYNPLRRDATTVYVALYGRENRVDHCSFLRKKNLGVVLYGILTYEDCLNNHNKVDHNLFGPREVYGSNGAETIRIGTSQQCTKSSRTEISDNLFLRCNGEVEVISIKSCDNVIRGNLFYECEGVLALRHGDRNIAENNVFVGNGVRNTGGIRIVGESQIVRNNRFYGLVGDRFFSALALMNAVPNSLPNRYMQVKDVKIENNLFVDCTSIEFGCGNDYERTLAPDNILFKNNLVWNESIEQPYESVASVDGFRFKSNKAHLGAGKLPRGFSEYKGQKPCVPGWAELISANPELLQTLSDTHLSSQDEALLQELSENTPSAGCNVAKTGQKDVMSAGALVEQTVDAAEKTVDAVEQTVDADKQTIDSAEKTIKVSDAASLVKAVSDAADGTEVVLDSELYVLEQGVKVSSNICIKAAEGVSPVIRYAGRASENMITICNGGELTVKGICFDGVLSAGRRLAKAAISTADDMIDTYNLTVEDCSFVNYGEGGFIPIRGLKGTFAHRFTVRGCRFEALSGDAVNLAAETDDKGRYSADDVIIEDCHFERILGIPVNIYRGGSDESTAGPYVYIRGCEFKDCCNKVRGSVIRVIGAQILEIAGCSFIDSGRGGYSIRLDDAPWERISVKGNTYRNSGPISANRQFVETSGIQPNAESYGAVSSASALDKKSSKSAAKTYVTASTASASDGKSSKSAAEKRNTQNKQCHPKLLLTADGVAQIKATSGTVTHFDEAVRDLIAQADVAVARPICVPEPKEGGGGYSHEMHKLNYYDMYACGVAWQITSDTRYAEKVKEILYAYAELYPTLGYHPLGLSKTPGRIFWQTLNESVWLVHTSVAYDCVYDFLSKKDRDYIETNLLRQVSDFIMNGTPDYPENNKIFNKMHNHGTWATAAVGMAAMAMGDDDMLDKALYGSDKTGKHGGFIQQLDYLFSPDGYFTEGAYYLRYAIWPFVMFAQCIDNYRSDIGIFGYRDGIILKAVDALLQQAYDGVFMRFNDALEKGYNAQELIYAVNIAYNADKSNKKLLSVARDYQDRVLVSDAGYAVAKAIQDGEAQPMTYTSRFFRDGGDGKEGGFAVIRSFRPGLNSAVTLKATSHGLSHGHYDKLTFAYYDCGNEIITDYGASRFLNIEAKYNGHYTKQNKSYAMTTIAHNTLVVDEKSHFNGDFDESSKHWPEIAFVSLDDPEFQVVSAVERNAALCTVMRRVLAYADVPFLEYPLIIDLLKAESSSKHQYDYPIHYNGHMISLSVPYEKAMDKMTPLGKANGYQHLWKESTASGGDGVTTYTWLTGYRMYSVSTATTPDTEVYLARIGANDYDYNLRNEPMYMLREKDKSSHLFASCIETHGRYDLQVEQSENLVHSCRSIETLVDNDESIVVKYGFEGGHTAVFAVALKDASEDAVHTVDISAAQRGEVNDAARKAGVAAQRNGREDAAKTVIEWQGAAGIFYDVLK